MVVTLKAEHFARLRKADPAALAVEPAIHQFYPCGFRDINVVVVDRHKEPRGTGRKLFHQLAVDSLPDAPAAHGHSPVGTFHLL